MELNQVYEQHSVLKEFVKSLEPDIADKDLQGFINDFLGIEKEVAQSETPVVEGAPLVTNKLDVNAQNEVLITLVKEAVYQFLEKKYQEEKDRKQLRAQYLLNEIEPELDINSDCMLEELSSMGISKILPEENKVLEALNAVAPTKRTLGDRFFLTGSLLAILLILCSLIYYFNSRNEYSGNVFASKDSKSAAIEVVATKSKLESSMVGDLQSAFTKTNPFGLVVNPNEIESRNTNPSKVIQPNNALSYVDDLAVSSTLNSKIKLNKRSNRTYRNSGNKKYRSKHIAKRKTGGLKHENVYFAEQE